MKKIKPSTPSSWKAMLLAAAAFAAGVCSVIPEAFAGAATAADSAFAFGSPRRRSNPAFVAPHPSALLCIDEKIECSVGPTRPTHPRIVTDSAVWTATSLLMAPTSTASDDPSNNAMEKNKNTMNHPEFSESNVIRILRASPHRNGNRNNNQTIPQPAGMTACYTTFDVLYLLGEASHIPLHMKISPSSFSNLSNEEMISIVEPIIGSISPNIAAAALRRLCSPPFLPSVTPDKRSQRYMNKNKWMDQMNNASAIERSIYGQLIQLLLKKLSDIIEYQSQGLDTTANSDYNGSPALIPHKDSWMAPPTFSKMDEAKQLNWYALADLLYSLSSLCDVLGNRNRGNNIIKGHLLTNISPREQYSIMNLFDDTIRYLSWDNKMASSFVRCVGPRRLVRDVIKPFVVMTMARRKVNRDSVEQDGVEQIRRDLPNDSYNQLMAILSLYLVLPHSLDKLVASDLSMVLWAMTKIYHPMQLNGFAPANEEKLTLKQPQKILLKTFMKRLRKYRVRSSARGNELVQAVWSVARLMSYLEEQDRALQPKLIGPLMPLPILLPGEDGSDSSLPSMSIEGGNSKATLQPAFYPMFPTQPAVEAIAASKDPADLPTETLHKEAIIMFHTLVNEIVHPPRYSGDKTDEKKSNKAGVEEIKLNSLSLSQIADILHAATSLDISHDDVAAAITAVLKHLTTNPSSTQNAIQQCRRCKDISRLSLSLQRLRVGTGMFDDMGSRIDLEKQCVQLLGERFLDIVHWHNKKQSKRFACDAKTLTQLVRSGVMMFQGNSAATAAMLDAASIMILDQNGHAEEDEDWNSPSFLSSCNEFELSNYLFAFALAKRFDEDVFISLTDQMAEDYILESCTPSSASRAMWSCSMLLSIHESSSSGSNPFNNKQEFALNIGGESFLRERQVDLFHQLAPQLLFSPLSPTDASMAMWAMAKAQYVIDKGIFDQLAVSLASDEMLNRSNSRLISQALWSCGKMVEFEDAKVVAKVAGDSDEDNGESKDDEVVLPPYLKCAEKYLWFLIANREQMTPKHASQAIWTIGKLRLSDTLLVNKMADIASHLCPRLNAREVSNCVWGLCKVGGNAEVVSKLVHHVVDSPNTLARECTAQEAANMLFALGKLRIRDKDLFEKLSAILGDQLHEATSQAIANSLWAHEVVRIAPPAELLSTWAQDRLGIAALGQFKQSEIK